MGVHWREADAAADPDHALPAAVSIGWAVTVGSGVVEVAVPGMGRPDSSHRFILGLTAVMGARAIIMVAILVTVMALVTWGIMRPTMPGLGKDFVGGKAHHRKRCESQ